MPHDVSSLAYILISVCALAYMCHMRRRIYVSVHEHVNLCLRFRVHTCTQRTRVSYEEEDTCVST